MYKGIDSHAQRLVNLYFSPIFAKICFTAIKLDVFSHLNEPKTAMELAVEMDWHQENCESFLNALTAMELLIRKDQSYHNTASTASYLVRSSKNYMGDLMLGYSTLEDYNEEIMMKLIISGPEAVTEKRLEHTSFAEMSEIMRNMQRGARASELLEILANIPEFSRAKKLLDLGAGTGMLGITAAEANEQLSVVLFDTPHMAQALNDSISQSVSKNRITAVCGDYMQDDIGSGYDMIIAFNTLNAAKMMMGPLMSRLYLALNPGGVLITAGDGIREDKLAPPDAVASWLPFSLKGMDFGMPQQLIPDAGKNAGFASAETFTAATYMGTADINVLRK